MTLTSKARSLHSSQAPIAAGGRGTGRLEGHQQQEVEAMFTRPWLSPAPPGDIWDEFERLHTRVNRLFADAGGATPPPAGHAMNVWSGQDDVVVTVLAPGVAPEEIEIALEGQHLIIAGRPAREGEQERSWLLRERRPTLLSRRVRLPYRADEKKIEAALRNGILRVVVPRAESDKPRRIAVQSA
jgi:HSP20 family protein